MQKDYLSYLESNINKIKKEIPFFDAVVFGSIVKGSLNPSDLDLVLIFENKSLKERVELASKVKSKLNLKEIKLDLQTINLSELFEKNFLARQSILIEGYSLIHRKNFSEVLGFKGFSIFSYNLSGLNHLEKTKFIYALIGRNSPGLVKKCSGKSLGRGCFLIPVENSLIFEDFLKKWKINYTRSDCLIPFY